MNEDANCKILYMSSNQNTFMIHSDKVLTIAEPTGKLKDKYEGLLK